MHFHDDEAEDPETMDAALLLPLLARHLRQQRSQELEQFGLTPSQARAFAVINRCLDHGTELRLSTLAERLRIAPRSATEVVDALQDKGLVRRAPSPGDRRAVAVEITDEGAQLRDQMRPVLGAARRARADDLFAALDDDERERLTVLLRKLMVAADLPARDGRPGPR